jgi:hypothetical protein
MTIYFCSQITTHGFKRMGQLVLAGLQGCYSPTVLFSNIANLGGEGSETLTRFEGKVFQPT